jgi:hypothetical protein
LCCALRRAAREWAWQSSHLRDFDDPEGFLQRTSLQVRLTKEAVVKRLTLRGRRSYYFVVIRIILLLLVLFRIVLFRNRIIALSF